MHNIMSAADGAPPEYNVRESQLMIIIDVGICFLISYSMKEARDSLLQDRSIRCRARASPCLEIGSCVVDSATVLSVKVREILRFVDFARFGTIYQAW